MKKSSLRTINNGIRRIYKGVFKKEYIVGDESLLIKNHGDVIEYISGIKSTSVRKNLLCNVKHVIGKDPFNTFYGQFFKKCVRIHKENYILKKGKLKKWIPLEKYPILRRKWNRSTSEYKVISIYIYMPALRGEDIFNTRIDFGDNYIDKKTWTLIISKHKTMKTYGTKYIRIPIILRKLFDNLEKGDYIICNKFGNKYTQDSYTHLLWRVFGKGYSTNAIRHTYVCELNNYGVDIKIKSHISKMMGHSLGTQEFVYNNIKTGNFSSREYMKRVIEYIKKCIIF